MTDHARDDSTGADRRSRLLAVKLRTLVAEHTGAGPETGPEPGSERWSGTGPETAPGFAAGAGLVVDGAAWTLLDDRPAQRLGSALAWALRRGARSLHVVAERETGLLARRASQFSFPITVWRPDGRVLVAAEPADFAPSVLPHPSHLELRELIAAGGATPIVEHGVVFGEVRGLEVCRVVDAPDAPDRRARLEVGVGVHDREAFQMLHGDTPTVESLSRVVDAVRAHRVPGAPRHPFNRMAPERFVRWQIEDDPSSIGLRSVSPAEPPVARSSVVDTVPCVAHGVGTDGAPVVVVCSSGVDLDVVPYAADARLAAAGAFGASGAATTGVDPVQPDGEVPARSMIVLPARDRLAVTVELAGLLDQSVELVSLD